MSETKERVFMEFCQSCKRKHRMTLQPCPSCGGRAGWTPQPVSDRVADDCRSLMYSCDACEAYKDHMR